MDLGFLNYTCFDITNYICCNISVHKGKHQHCYDLIFRTQPFSEGYDSCEDSHRSNDQLKIERVGCNAVGMLQY